MLSIMICLECNAAACSAQLPTRTVLVQGKTIFKQKKECCAGSLEGQFLRSIVQLTRATSVLEVGMFTGTSTLAMAQALPDFGKVGLLFLCEGCCGGCFNVLL
jgi:predicted O-methyltransferase YrrM